MKAFIFAAGLGTRLKEETQHTPKALVKVGGKPMLQHVIEKLRGEGITDFVVNVHHYPELIIAFLKQHDLGVNIEISDESNMLLETGGALKKAGSLFRGNREPVLMYNVDVLSDVSITALLREHFASGALATLVVRNRKTQRYFKFDAAQRLVGWVNHKTGEKKVAVTEAFEQATERAFSGIHVASPEIFNLMPPEERFSMTDLYLSLAKQQLIHGFFDDSAFWLDVGKPESLMEARKLMG